MALSYIDMCQNLHLFLHSLLLFCISFGDYSLFINYCLKTFYHVNIKFQESKVYILPKCNLQWYKMEIKQSSLHIWDAETREWQWHVIVAYRWSKQRTIKKVGAWVSVKQIIDYSPNNFNTSSTNCVAQQIRGPMSFQQ